VAGVLVLIMVATTYLTQRQMIARTGRNSDPTQAMIQKFMLYGIPASLLVSGALFPIGVVIYWVTTNLFSMGQQFWVLKKMPPPNLSGKPEPKEISVETAKALAPKPGVKPVNPKKGARTSRPTASTATAADAANKMAAPAKTTAAKTTAAKGSPSKASPAKAAGSKATPAKAPDAKPKSGNTSGGTADQAGSEPPEAGAGAGVNGRADADSEAQPAGSSSNPAGTRRPQDSRNRKRKGGRR
jgi:YidC/Oxa1 family membrane protein insertase